MKCDSCSFSKGEFCKAPVPIQNVVTGRSFKLKILNSQNQLFDKNCKYYLKKYSFQAYPIYNINFCHKCEYYIKHTEQCSKYKKPCSKVNTGNCESYEPTFWALFKDLL